MRNYLIAGNWKMNKTIAEAVDFANEVQSVQIGEGVEAAILAPFTQLAPLKSSLEGTEIKVGAQNVHYMPSGAYTGEVSASMLKELGINYCIVGHSERREYFGETDTEVNRKLIALIEAGITPILCVGESLKIREAGGHLTFVGGQVYEDLSGISIQDVKKIVIAYEPIWAIGTGKTATPDEADMMCGFIRGLIEGLYDDVTAERMQILYGGSMKPENAADLLSKTNIDGGLIGGASLKSDSFKELITIATEASK